VWRHRSFAETVEKPSPSACTTQICSRTLGARRPCESQRECLACFCSQSPHRGRSDRLGTPIPIDGLPVRGPESNRHHGAAATRERFHDVRRRRNRCCDPASVPSEHTTWSLDAHSGSGRVWCKSLTGKFALTLIIIYRGAPTIPPVLAKWWLLKRPAYRSGTPDLGATCLRSTSKSSGCSSI
jgi:hypothetical protein